MLGTCRAEEDMRGSWGALDVSGALQGAKTPASRIAVTTRRCGSGRVTEQRGCCTCPQRRATPIPRRTKGRRSREGRFGGRGGGLPAVRSAHRGRGAPTSPSLASRPPCLCRAHLLPFLHQKEMLIPRRPRKGKLTLSTLQCQKSKELLIESWGHVNRTQGPSCKDSQPERRSSSAAPRRGSAQPRPRGCSGLGEPRPALPSF